MKELVFEEQLVRDKQLFEQGSEFALHDALKLCQQGGRPLPKWVVEGTLKRLWLMASGDEKAILRLMRNWQKLSKHMVRSIVFEEHLANGVAWKTATRNAIEELVREGIEETPTYDAVKESVLLIRSPAAKKRTPLSRKRLSGKKNSM